MASARVTIDEFEVQGNYGFGEGWECVYTGVTMKEARDAMKDHRLNEPQTPFRVRKKRVRVAPCPACEGGFPINLEKAPCCGRVRPPGADIITTGQRATR